MPGNEGDVQTLRYGYVAMDHIHNYFLKVAGDYNFNAVAFKFETCT